MGTIFDLGIVCFILLPLGAWLTWYLWIAYRTTKPDMMKTDVKNAYFLKRIRQQIEERKIDFEEMMQEYHESVKIWKRNYSEKGVLDEIDEEIDGEIEDLEQTNKKKQ